jgi:hypothetical protein
VTHAASRDRRTPRRSHRINPSFSPAEYADIVAAAHREGLTPTGFCARAALAVARGAPAPERARFEALAALQAELFDARTAVVRTGVNLNQAVAALNTTGSPPPWLVRATQHCERSLQGLDDVVDAIHRRLR